VPAEQQAPQAPPVEVTDKFTDAQRAEGGKWFGTYCTICHGGPVNPDLMRSQVAQSKDAWRSVVIDGALAGNGMASFRQQLTPDQAETIRAYIADQAHRLKPGKQ
jgi:mono/diheme cytochrome c family protein